MGEIQKERNRGKLIFGILVSEESLFKAVERRIEYDYGEIDTSSPAIDFIFTDYYEKEMGSSILRKWVSCKELIFEDELVETKIHANDLEKLFTPEGKEGRMVNIDPGVITLDKLILASTKKHSHRILIGGKIYGEFTLTFQKNKGFAPNPWTYPDYKDAENIKYFNSVREIFKNQLIEEQAGKR